VSPLNHHLAIFNGIAKEIYSYTSCLLSLVLPPLVKHGICLEAHGQNIVCAVLHQNEGVEGFRRVRLRWHSTPRSNSSITRPRYVLFASRSLHSMQRPLRGMEQNSPSTVPEPFGETLRSIGFGNKGRMCNCEGIYRGFVEVLNPEESEEGKTLPEFLLAKETAVQCF
jgi:hypothetical protein